MDIQLADIDGPRSLLRLLEAGHEIATQLTTHGFLTAPGRGRQQVFGMQLVEGQLGGDPNTFLPVNLATGGGGATLEGDLERLPAVMREIAVACQ